MNTDYYELDPSGMATLQQSLMEELDQMDAETYAYFLAHGARPDAPDSQVKETAWKSTD